MPSQFIFTVCQVGAEATLKKEISKEHPALKFAFSRPGFVTFKNEKEMPADYELHSVFARAYGLSLTKGELADLNATVKDTAEKLLAEADGQKRSGGKLRLHIWERDQHKPGEEPKDFKPGAWKAAIFTQLKQMPEFSTLFLEGADAKEGDLVLDVIGIDEGKFWLGYHIHKGYFHPKWPGGAPPITLPNEAPSRAYLKLEEAVLFTGAPLKPGDVAVEIGSAPGGASYALLKRGLNVVGIDPGEMSPTITAFGEERFMHIQTPVANVLREDLPDTVHWLLVDMNVAPNIAIFQVDRLASRMRSTLLGVLLTVKLNDWKTAELIPDLIAHLEAIGLKRIRATQLASNKQEIFLYGLSPRGMQRDQ